MDLRHKAAVGITEKTDSLSIIVCEEQRGIISYIKNGEFVPFFKDLTELGNFK